RLEHADRTGQAGRRHAGAGAGAARRRARARDVRVGAVIEVEQRPLRPLEQQALAGRDRAVEKLLGVGEVRPQLLAPIAALRDELVEVRARLRLPQAAQLLPDARQLHTEAVGQVGREQVAGAEAIARRLAL